MAKRGITNNLKGRLGILFVVLGCWCLVMGYTVDLHSDLGVDLHNEKYTGVFNKLLFKNDHDLRCFSENADNGKDYVN